MNVQGTAKNPNEYTIADTFDMALEALEDVPLELEWTMPELFRGYVWKQIPPPARRAAGMQFKEAMEKRNDVKLLSEKNHVQQYKRVDPSRYLMPHYRKNRRGQT